ncbi:hypothetical protein QFZ28_002940 [Neobacillus niacini]|nr:hypothetical protein [Neobacillus niacini]
MFQESEYFKEKSKKRYKIEAKNSKLKRRHGYMFHYPRVYLAWNYMALWPFTVNLKRILKLLG